MDSTDKNSVLIVDDESANIIALTHILSPEYVVYAATDGPEALETAKEYAPDVILLDIVMPGMDGYEVFSRLKSEEKTRGIPVIFVTGLGNNEDEEKGLNLGAADYISKPFGPAIVKLRVHNLIKTLNMIDTIKRLSETDQLTGLSNRRIFDYRLRLVWEHAKRDKTPLSIFMIDIDHFKKYNDQYGHLQGDTALQAVARAIEQPLKRAVDFLARWGGEEFIALLPDTDPHGALTVAENIRKNVEATLIPGAGGGTTSLTVSIGVNTHTPTPECSVRDFIAGADQALYAAKNAGRNNTKVLSKGFF
jgi:diguanylate cyclase (GGDEF)-like protein